MPIYDDTVTEKPEGAVLTQERVAEIADRLRRKGMLPLPICSGTPHGLSFEEYEAKIREAAYIPLPEARPTVLDREIAEADIRGDHQHAAFLRGLRRPDGTCTPFPGERRKI